MDFYRKIKDASIKAVKHSADIIKTVSNDVKAVATGNMFDIQSDNKQDVNSSNNVINIPIPKTQSNNLSDFVATFRQLCKFIDSLKSNTFHWITNAEAEVIRNSLKYIISELCSENKLYKGYDCISRNSKEVFTMTFRNFQLLCV